MAKKKSRRKPPARQGTTAAAGKPTTQVGSASEGQAPIPGVKKQQRSALRAAAAQKKQKRQTFLIWFGLALVLVGVTAASIFLGGGGATGVTDAGGWDLPAMGPTEDTQERVTLAEFSGTPTVVNFFASWCIECDRELPIFATISRELEGTVDFVGIASAETGNPLFMPEKHGVDWWPLARDVGPRGGNDLAVSLGARPGAMPLTAFYDENGSLITVQLGAINEATLRGNLTQFYGIEF